MITMGCDVGAMATKIVLFKSGSLVAFAITRNEGKLVEAVNRSVENVLAQAGLDLKSIQGCVCTGRGEKYLAIPHKSESIVNCLARGALWERPAIRTVVDMGGLSSTALSISESGKVLEYRSNDRCAAGTGFFLELAAQALEIPVEKLGPVSLDAIEPVHISSQCAVFRESEIVTHMNEGADVIDIVAGINYSLGLAVSTMVRRLGTEPEIAVTGGVAKNIGVVQALEKTLGLTLAPVKVDPQLVGAIGAALSA